MSNVDPSTARELPDRLARQLLQPLPGAAAQRQMAPEMTYGRHHGPPPAWARPAAVMALLYRFDELENDPDDDDVKQWRLPLTKRPATMKTHAGQVSLPGGMVEPGETSQQAALRELEEELGVVSRAVHILGRLSPIYVFVSNFLVTPFIGILEGPPDFHPDPNEVDRLIEADLSDLLAPERRTSRFIQRNGISFHTPCFQVSHESVWGATAMILSEFITVLESSGKP